MTLTPTQLQLLQLTAKNQGLFKPSLTPLRGAALHNVINSLMKRNLFSHHTDQDYLITPTGLQIISKQKSGNLPTKPRKGSKVEKLTNMLRRKNGATNAQIQAALSWQTHSVRGIISGTIKKKMGLEVITEKNKSGDLVYKIMN